MMTPGQIVRWFEDSPDAGDPNCICSLCGELIGLDECPVRVFRIYPVDREARFHEKCYPFVDPRHFEPAPGEGGLHTV